MRRPEKLDEVVEVYAFVASDDAGFIDSAASEESGG